MLLTRSPVSTTPKGRFVPRLACVKPAASVRPEPGSNSPLRDRYHYVVHSIETTRAREPCLMARSDPSSKWGYYTRWLFNAVRHIPADGVHRDISMLCHWLLAPCAVLKERSHGPPGFLQSGESSSRGWSASGWDTAVLLGLAERDVTRSLWTVQTRPAEPACRAEKEQ